MTRQAMQLGLLPRLQVIQTLAEGYGQIYLPTVNWLLMVVTLGLSIGSGSSSSLAAAYGIAVSATMLATTVLLSTAMREVWSWPLFGGGRDRHRVCHGGRRISVHQYAEGRGALIRNGGADLLGSHSG